MYKRTSTKSANSKLVASAATAACLVLLSGCGGGGSAAPAPAPGGADGFGPGNVAGCPRSQITDVWLNNRLACLSVGQAALDVATSGPGNKADRAYMLAQTAQDTGLNNVLGAGRSRWFKHFLCVRNAPEGVSTVLLAGDVGVAIGLGSTIRPRYLPAGISASAVNIGGGREPAVEAMACDPAKHPLIVNFDTGKVESVNRDALATLSVYDF